MIFTKKHSIALLAIVSSMVFAGCQSDSGSDSDPSNTVSDWDKIETAQPAEATVENAALFFNVARSGKGIQSDKKSNAAVLDAFMHSLNLDKLDMRGKVIKSAPSEYDNEDTVSGSESGTLTEKYTVNYDTSTLHLLQIYDNYHDIDDMYVDACGNPDETDEDGTWYCDIGFDPDMYDFISFECTVISDLRIGATTFEKESSFILKDNDGDGEIETYNHNSVGDNNGVSFALVDVNETVWEDTLYEYSYVSTGKLYFNGLTEYMTVDETLNSPNNLRVEGLCNDIVYSGLLYLRGKDDALVEFNITA